MDALKKAEQAKAQRNDEHHLAAVAPPLEQAPAHETSDTQTLAKAANTAEQAAPKLPDGAIHPKKNIGPPTPGSHEELELSIDDIEPLEASSPQTDQPEQSQTEQPDSVAEPVQKTANSAPDAKEATAQPPIADTPPPAAKTEPAEKPKPTEPTPATKVQLPRTAPMLIGKRRFNRTYLWAGLVTVLALIGFGYYLMAMLESTQQSSVVATATTDRQPDERLPENPLPVQPPTSDAATKPEAKTAKQPARASAKTVAPAKPKTQPQAPTVQPTRALTIQRTDVEDPLYRLLQQAYIHYQSGEFGQAEQRYRQALAKESSNRDALLGLAAIARKQNRVNDARGLYNRLLSINPKDSTAAAGLISLTGQGASSGNITQLKLMLNEEPSAAHLHFALGNEYAAQSLWPQAQQAYFNAYRFTPNNSDYAYNLAVSLERIGQSQTALGYYRRALELASDHPQGFDPQRVSQRIESLTPTEAK